MTVCIGAVCANLEGVAEKAVVVASDRMVTMGDFIEFEHEVSKVTQITENILALTAGDALRGARLTKNLIDKFRLGAQSVNQVGSTATQLYQAMRGEQIDLEHFRPRGISMDQFYLQGLQAQLVPGLVSALDQAASTYNWMTEFLIAGVDEVSAHVYSVGHPGLLTEYQQIGYTAIGSGSIHAIQSLIGFKHSGKRGLLETLFAVYASKRRSEVAPGVGEDTDLAIIQHGGIRWLSHEQLKQLDEIYNEYQRPLSQEVIDRIKELHLLPGENEDATT